LSRGKSIGHLMQVGWRGALLVWGSIGRPQTGAGEKVIEKRFSRGGGDEAWFYQQGKLVFSKKKTAFIGEGKLAGTSAGGIRAKWGYTRVIHPRGRGEFNEKLVTTEGGGCPGVG